MYVNLLRKKTVCSFAHFFQYIQLAFLNVPGSFCCGNGSGGGGGSSKCGCDGDGSKKLLTKLGLLETV